MSIIDYILPEDKATYNEIVARAAAYKAAHPAERAPRGPMTEEQKDKMELGRLNKMKQRLADMKAKKAK